jgi:hypothetical protein
MRKEQYNDDDAITADSEPHLRLRPVLQECQLSEEVTKLLDM